MPDDRWSMVAFIVCTFLIFSVMLTGFSSYYLNPATNYRISTIDHRSSLLGLLLHLRNDLIHLILRRTQLSLAIRDQF